MTSDLGGCIIVRPRGHCLHSAVDVADHGLPASNLHRHDVCCDSLIQLNPDAYGLLRNTPGMPHEFGSLCKLLNAK